MELHRVRRVAEVLVASQIRAARNDSDPRSFFGRGISLLVYDAVLFLGVFGLAYLALDYAARQTPSAIAGLAPLVEPLLPLVAIAVVLITGVLFELTATSRFSGSDAVNWLPIRPSEYVLASAVAVAYSYSLPVAFTLGLSLALALVTGTIAAFGVSVAVSVVGLLEGGLLIEILRSTTQRTATVLGGRAARYSLVVRAAALVVVILALQLVFNPVLLLQWVGSITALVTFIPLLWGARAVLDATSASWLSAGAFSVGLCGVVALLGAAAVQLRLRFWAPSPAELHFEPHPLGERHTLLAALGFSPLAAALAAKDLRGLARRRELLPILIVPLVVAVLAIFGVYSGGPGGSRAFTGVLFAAWISGLFALLLSTTSIGQERVGLQTLYVYPLGPFTLFRAKAGICLLLALLLGAGSATLISVADALSPELSAATFALAAASACEGTFVGLSFASRYSDFQERPRPQFLRPAAMLAAMLLGVVLMFGTILPIDLALTGGASPGEAAIPVAVGAAIAVLASVAGYGFSRSGFRGLMRESPV